MRSLLEKKLFPFVIKPGRYIGGELGQIVKPPENRLKMALGYPDMYEIGMSYLGTQILYNIINKDDRFLCERFYAPDRDAEAIIRANNIPYFSLESHRPLKEFDLVGFTLAYEMVYSNLLNILELSGIPLRSAGRGEDDPLIIAGGPVVHNPEPMAPFIDIFHIGDAEENIIKLLTLLHENRELSRDKKLEKLAQEIPSVYIPKFYDSATHKPSAAFAPEKIRSFRVKSLPRSIYPSQPIIPFIETVHDRLSVEIMRGCPCGCRFCQATAIYRPTRPRDKEEIAAQIHDQIARTGFDEVTLLSLSSGDYPDIVPLTVRLSRELLPKKVALSLPSLRPGALTLELINAIKMTRKTGLTFAPEAGSERLRAVIRKDITDNDLYDTIRLAFQNSWNLVKLYFMIGLPTETDEDIQGIVTMIRTVSRIAREVRGKNSINVTISPFSPKSHTPFQWDEQPSPEAVAEKGEYIRRNAGNAFVAVKLRDPHLSFLEGVLGRGGQEMAAVIETAFRMGARFDGWSEGFDFQLWLNAFEKSGINPHDYLKGKSFSEVLPWSHIELDVSQEHLVKERNRTSTMLRESPRRTEPLIPAEEPQPDEDDGFGRSRKKAAAKASVAPTKGQVRVKWGRTGLTRFLSHLDNLRVIERALRRSELPVEYSQGFHPHMKMSFGPPLPLGYTSEAEYFDLALERPFTSDMANRLRGALPDGFSLIMARSLINMKESLSSKLNRAVYEVVLENKIDCEEKITALLSRETIEINRAGKEEVKQVDIRPAIFEIRCLESGTIVPSKPAIHMELGVGSGGYARPPEVIQAAGIADEKFLPALIIHRKDLLHIDPAGNRFTPMEF
ncbi:conserved hypothetical protein [Candidatus Zixiibacteriota bacterium]|nr:conserved hypothetical protein [candidate division Zixibacteria bacterium]